MTTSVGSLERSVSPPPRKRRKSGMGVATPQDDFMSSPSLAAIEAGEARIRDHLDYFSKHLREVARPIEEGTRRLHIDEFTKLYQRNNHGHGRHFVVHQHNHPVAGVHYDLRLQFSQTSACSWAIPYGLPGDANSRRQGRMAVETRVHTLWNNLIESASHSTGSLLIWDTGEYEILPRKMPTQAQTTDEESDSSYQSEVRATSKVEENEKLMIAFRGRHIKLRLHGTRLPSGYTVTLRLPRANDIVRGQSRTGKNKPRRKRQRSALQRQSSNATGPDTSSEDETSAPDGTTWSLQSEGTGSSRNAQDDAVGDAAGASDDENVEEAEMIRVNNAYTGAFNTIGSVHQRNWYLSLDRVNSGFEQHGSVWTRKGTTGFEAFYVQGAEVERSVVTGRLSSEVMADEGVQGFQPRKLWRPIVA